MATTPKFLKNNLNINITNRAATNTNLITHIAKNKRSSNIANSKKFISRFSTNNTSILFHFRINSNSNRTINNFSRLNNSSNLIKANQVALEPLFNTNNINTTFTQISRSLKSSNTSFKRKILSIHHNTRIQALCLNSFQNNICISIL